MPNVVMKSTIRHDVKEFVMILKMRNDDVVLVSYRLFGANQSHEHE